MSASAAVYGSRRSSWSVTERVHLGAVALVARQRRSLVPHDVGHGDASQVVHERRRFRVRAACFTRELGDPARVPAQPRRLEVGEVGEHEQ